MLIFIIPRSGMPGTVNSYNPYKHLFIERKLSISLIHIARSRSLSFSENPFNGSIFSPRKNARRVCQNSHLVTLITLPMIGVSEMSIVRNAINASYRGHISNSTCAGNLESLIRLIIFLLDATSADCHPASLNVFIFRTDI